MMTTTSGDLYRTDLRAYLAKLRTLVGDRERIEILAETPRVLASLVEAHTPAQMQMRPFDGKWTPSEILGHLGDTEWVFGYRIRQVLGEERPQIYAMDHELWVRGQRHNERDPGELLETFRGLRAPNIRLWQRMTPADLQRVGIHNERGPESLETTLLLQAGHDLSHIDQLKRYLAAVTNPA
jgi:hypothetical protein